MLPMLRKFLPALLLVACFTAPVAATCPTGESNVPVDLVRDGNGDPVILSKSTDRREHARVSQQLADDLGITVDPNEDVNPQIRAIVDLPAALQGENVKTAVFTVVEVYPGGTHELEIYHREDADDEDNGFFKLFDTADPLVVLNTAQVTIHAAATSQTTFVGGNPPTVDSFCEPPANGSDGFTDEARIEADKRFVLFVPHGGDIEQGTSEQIDDFETALEGRGIQPNVWHARAEWPASTASEQFHVTSSEIDEDTFPGLGELLTGPQYDAGNNLDFQYAVSLHGFGKYNGNGLVLGGRAHREVKCYIARGIQQRLLDDNLGAVAYYIWDLDGDDTNNIDLPDVRDLKVTDERPDVGLSGTDRDNIVNRVSPNETGVAGHGGIQVEESRALRDDPLYSVLVAEEIAEAMADLILDPSLIDPQSTAICDTLVATSAASGGQIGDRVWLDENDDGIQDGGEPGVFGVTVELLDVNASVVSTTSSDAEGLYRFHGVVAGDYSVRFTPPVGYLPAQQTTALFPLAENTVDDSHDAGFTADCHDVTLLAFGTPWRTSPDVAVDWETAGFDDSTWTLGMTRMGYPTSSYHATEIPDGGTTSYFRTSFDVDDVSLFSAFVVDLYRDDGAVVYLNGNEILRSNMPQGAIDDLTEALGSSRGSDSVALPANLLLQGTNVLAVEVHERGGSDSDLAFNLEVRSTVCLPCLTEVFFPADRGTYLQDGSATVRGAESSIKMDAAPTVRHGLLAFDVSGLPQDASVLHAEIGARVTDRSHQIFSLVPLTLAWDEGDAQWSLAEAGVSWEIPGAQGASDRDRALEVGQMRFNDSTPHDAVTVLNPHGRALVEGWIRGTTPNHGILIPADGGQDNGLAFESDEDQVLGPYLRVVYASSCGG